MSLIFPWKMHRPFRDYHSEQVVAIRYIPGIAQCRCPSIRHRKRRRWRVWTHVEGVSPTILFFHDIPLGQLGLWIVRRPFRRRKRRRWWSWAHLRGVLPSILHLRRYFGGIPLPGVWVRVVAQQSPGCARDAQNCQGS